MEEERSQQTQFASVSDRSKVANIKIMDRALYNQLFATEVRTIYSIRRQQQYIYRGYYPNDGNQSATVDWEVVYNILKENPKYASKMKDTYGWSILHYLCFFPLPETIIIEQCFDLLIQLNPNAIFDKDNYGSYPLHFACRSNSCLPVNVTLTLIELFPQAMQQKDCNGCYPLFLACKNQNSKMIIISTLIDKFPQPLKEKDKHGVYPIHNLCKGHQKQPQFENYIVQLIRLYPCTVQFTDRCGLTPLHIACRYRQSLRVIQALLDIYPQAVQQLDQYGQYPLYTAITHKQSESILLLLIELFPKAIEKKDRYGNYLLQVAYKTQVSANVLQKLIEIFPMAVQSGAT